MDWSNDGKSIYFHSLNLNEHPFRIKQADTTRVGVNTLLQTSDNYVIILLMFAFCLNIIYS